MGGDQDLINQQLANLSFNPRLRMGGDSASESKRPPTKVSIHASAWEATGGSSATGYLINVSIHASAWEATAVGGVAPCASICFNPRLRMGGDTTSKGSRTRTGSFNPRLRMGGDRSQVRRAAKRWRFNPRLRMGGDIEAERHHRADFGFNPRLRMGGDQRHRDRASGPDRVSIHASAWEATAGTYLYRLAVDQFQSTPPQWEATPSPAAVGPRRFSFQSTPPHGRRPAMR